MEYQDPFIEREENRIAANALIALAKSLKPEELLTYKAMTAATGFKRGGDKLKTIWLKARKELMHDHNMVFRAEPNVGFRLLGPVEIVRRCGRERVQRARGQLGRGTRELETVSMGAVDDHSRLQLARQLELLDTKRREIASGFRASMRTSDNGTETIPRRPAE